ncbi:MAG: hypothetical protein NZ932_07240 [Candidatus Bathyarchaeota archaeon]|nr:hypothetical protein [Candidatus Bathyarchaeota archaeon]
MKVKMARTYILTEHERKILKRFVETGEKLNGLRNLIYIFKKAQKQLEADMQLINEALQKYG